MANPQVNFKIIALDSTRGQITVKFFNDDIPGGIVNAIDLPVQDGKILALRDQALTDYIMGFCPMAEFIRVAALKSGLPADLSYIEAMVVPEPQPLPVPEDTLPGETLIKVIDL